MVRHKQKEHSEMYIIMIVQEKCYIEIAIWSPQFSLLCQLGDQRSHFINLRVYVQSLILKVPFEYWLSEYAPFHQ